MLNQTPGTGRPNVDPIIPDAMMPRYDMFSYYNESHVSNQSTQAELDNIISLIANFDASSHYTFDLNKYVYSTLDRRINGKNPKDGIGNLVYRLFRYIPDMDVTYRILHKNYVVYVYITRPSVGIVTTNSTMTIIAINNKINGLVAHKVEIKKEMVGNKIELIRSSGAPYKAYLNNVIENRYNDFISYDYLIGLVGESLIKYITDYRTGSLESHLEYQKGDVEIAFIESCQNTLLSKGKVLSTNIESILRNYSSTDKSSNYYRHTYGRVITDSAHERYDWTGYTKSPLVKFSNKYSDFISLYIDVLDIFNPDNRTNILRYMLHPGLGTKLSFELPNRKFILTDYKIIGNRINIYAQYYINENIFITGFAVIANASSFNINTSISETRLNLNYIGVGEHTRVKFEDILSDIPNELTSVDNLMQLIKDVITLQIIIHDRPKMKNVLKQRTYGGGSRNKRLSGYGDRRVIVFKITGNIRDAKRYINLGYNRSIESTTQREYVRYCWERKGYWRRNQWGGLSYIQPTVCYRRLPLTDKEVHVID